MSHSTRTSSSSNAQGGDSLQQRIEQRTATVGVIALGYVGLPLLRACWEAGFGVLGFDIDQQKIDMLRRGENYLKHLGDRFTAEMACDTDRFEVSSDFARLDEPDVLIVCVPTPLGEHLDPDLQYIEKTSRAIGQRLRPGQLVVLESTTYPGTTREVMLPILQNAGLRYGEDFFLAYSPEREDPGRKDLNTRSIPRLVGGVDVRSAELAAGFYRQVVQTVVPVSSAEVAEAAKILENVYRAVNIALVNELKMILTEMNIDVWEVVEAAATKPFGFQAFYPGPGLGGHCIPIDPFYLTWKAREVGQHTRFIELAGQINQRMPDYVVQRTMLALNEHRKAVRDARILVLGLAYKPDVDDVRESPSFAIIEQLRELGAQVSYHDPHVPRTHPMRHYPDLPTMSSVPLDERTLREADCLVVATNHSAYDWQFITQHAALIVDTRNATAGFEDRYARIIKA